MRVDKKAVPGTSLADTQDKRLPAPTTKRKRESESIEAKFWDRRFSFIQVPQWEIESGFHPMNVKEPAWVALGGRTPSLTSRYFSAEEDNSFYDIDWQYWERSALDV
ncbi:hypothetical protein KUTeg_018599 [Tegillarca granosa]|uniref:Uncharacterized protein n=1 Tax=Tegillarca granosa TaxID=220873 RepID=A0ABQ9EIC9_TEGGR|nr:hypothetical protein KUTeg_018599 [Tegillarca granosa]